MPLAEIERMLAGAQRMGAGRARTRATRAFARLTPAAVTGNARDSRSAGCASSRWGREYLARVHRAATSCCGARRSRCAGCCGSCSAQAADVRSAASTRIHADRDAAVRASVGAISGSFMQADWRPPSRRDAARGAPLKCNRRPQSERLRYHTMCGLRSSSVATALRRDLAHGMNLCCARHCRFAKNTS